MIIEIEAVDLLRFCVNDETTGPRGVSRMDIARRELLGGLCSLPLLKARLKLDWPAEGSSNGTLPDKKRFPVDGVYLDAAYTHPMSTATRTAYVEYLQHRVTDDTRIGPGNNARDLAVRLYAKLINAEPSEIAVVPSTMEGENLIAASL
jgi:hypothetical protein